MKTIYLSLIIICCSCCLYSQPSMEWMSIVKKPIIDMSGTEVPSISMESENQGNVYVSYYDSADGDSQHRITKYDPFGATLWTYSETVNSYTRFITHLKLAGDNVFCVFQNYPECRLISLDASGNIKWEQSYMYGYWITSFEMDHKGNLYVTFDGSYNNDFRIVKYNSRGSLKWSIGYNGPANLEEAAYDVTVDNDQNVYVTGTTIAQGGPNTMHYDILTIKFNSNGALKWTSTYNGASDYHDLAKLITHDSQGFIIVAGWTFDLASYDGSYITIKYDPQTGNRIWEQLYQTPGRVNKPKALITDNQDNIYVAGVQVVVNNNSPTVKYSPAGSLLWSHVLYGAWADDIKVDGEQNVYLTGRYQLVHYLPSDSRTWKYDMNGSLLWDLSFDRGGNDFSSQISLGFNNLTIMGYSQNGYELPYVTYTAKYYEPGLRPLEETIKRNTSSQVPESFMLYNNYPNPFNAATKIKFDIPAGNARLVKLTVYDMLGRQITELVNQSMQAGSYELDFDGSSLASGTYFYRLEAGEFTAVKKMILIK